MLIHPSGRGEGGHEGPWIFLPKHLSPFREGGMGPGFSLYKSFLYVITYQGGEGGMKDPGFSSLNIFPLSGRGAWAQDFLYINLSSMLSLIREGRGAYRTLDFLP
jgi:hypothetical protein